MIGWRNLLGGDARAPRAALASIGVGLAVFALKLAAWRLTGSVALLSDALESLVNIAAAVMALVALRISAAPPDTRHPFGHHKAEYFSAIAEGALIVVAALLIVREAYGAFVDPRQLALPASALAIGAAATLVNAVWGALLVRWGREWRSPALQADGRHLLADVATSVGVLAGVGLAALTGWHLLDPTIAAIVGVYVLWSGYGVVRRSIGGLMDESADADTLRRIEAAIVANAPDALQAHDLRARVAGRALYIEFHLVVPGEMSVRTAHAICDRIERALAHEVGDGAVLIHVEPEEAAKLRGDGVTPPPIAPISGGENGGRRCG